MTMYSFFSWLNEALALPCTFLFIGVAVFLTLLLSFPQLRYIGKFFSLVTAGGLEKRKRASNMQAINPFHALFTAMSTTIGMGNIVGPSVAILAGGPGALFWMVVYTFFASVSKFTEVTMALHFRRKTEDGSILAGPTEYLKKVSGFLARWYGVIMVFLLAGWSALQANTLAHVYHQVHIPFWITGVALGLTVYFSLIGGAARIGDISSKLVPTMFTLYVVFSLIILFKDPAVLLYAMKEVCAHAFTASAAVGGFAGATVMQAMRWGSYRAAYITEAGLGTSSIPHSMADVQRATDQGILAMYSMVADTFLFVLSGLLVLVSGVWQAGEFRNTLMYEVFSMHFPAVGKIVLITCITLFVIGTVIGNSFNGSQSFASLTRHRWMRAYYIFISFVTFLGAVADVPLVWEIMDLFLVLVAIPNLIGLVILAIKYRSALKA